VRRADRRRVAGERAMSAERELVRVLLHRPAYFDRVVERVGAESFRDPELRRIFAVMLAQGADAGPDQLADALDADAVQLMQELLEEPDGLEHSDEAVAGSLTMMHERDLADRMGEIDRLLPISAPEEKDDLTREKMRLRAELASLGARWWKQFR
jgi:hypothetical protein